VLLGVAVRISFRRQNLKLQEVVGVVYDAEGNLVQNLNEVLIFLLLFHTVFVEDKHVFFLGLVSQHHVYLVLGAILDIQLTLLGVDIL